MTTMFTRPMQPCNADMSKIEYPCSAQRKWDGLKLIITGAYPNMVYRGRSLKAVKNMWLVEYLDEIFSAHPGVEFFLSGELQAGGSLDGCDGLFSASYREFTDLVYHVFDDLMKPELAKSFRLLRAEQAVDLLDTHVIQMVKTQTFDSEEDLLAFHADNEADPATDGTVVIRLDLPYKAGKRTVNEGYAVKIKDFKDAEAVIIGFNERVENTNPRILNPDNGKMERSTEKAGMVPQGDLGSFICEIVVDGVSQTFSVGSGLNDETRIDYWNRREELEHTHIKFKYQRFTKYGVPLLPVFLGLRSEVDMP